MEYIFNKKIIKKQYFLKTSLDLTSQNSLKALNSNKLLFIKNFQNNSKKKLFLYNKKIATCIKIKFSANNLFCTFWSISGVKTFRTRSAGMKKLNTSKKRLFFYAKLVLQSFFKELRLWRKKYRTQSSPFFFSLKAPKKLRNYIIKIISKYAFAINFEYAKPFNGCKVRKKRRKKRLGFRSYK